LFNLFFLSLPSLLLPLSFLHFLILHRRLAPRSHLGSTVRLELVGLAVIVLVTVAGGRVTVLAGLVMILAMVRVTVAAKAD
jgi:hypothetical protein